MAQETNEEQLVASFWRGGLNEIRLLLANRPLNINAEVNDECILYHAIRSGNTAIVELILDQPNITIGNLAVHNAVRRRTSDILSLLLNRGANPYGLALNSQTALMHAVQFGRKAHVELLIQQKINLTLIDKQNHAALDFALERLRNNPDRESIEILRVLLQNGAAFCRDLYDLEGVTPLMNHYESCCFFETRIDGELITSQTPGFESAIILELNKNEVPEGISPSTVILRCEELLNNPVRLSEKSEVIQLQRCFQMMSGEITLKKLCLEQLARQPNVDMTDLPYDLHVNYQNLRVHFRGNWRDTWNTRCENLAFTSCLGSAFLGLPMGGINAPCWAPTCLPKYTIVNTVCFYVGTIPCALGFIMSGIGIGIIKSGVCQGNQPAAVQMHDDVEGSSQAFTKDLVSDTFFHRFFQRVFKNGERPSAQAFVSTETRELPVFDDEVMENEIQGDEVELLLLHSGRNRNG